MMFGTDNTPYQLLKDKTTGKYIINIGGNNNIELKMPHWFFFFSIKPKYLLNGKKISISQKAKKPTVVVLPNMEKLTVYQGSSWSIYWNLFPKININGKNVITPKPAPTFERIIALLPFLPLALIGGGIIPTFFAFSAMHINLSILRSELNSLLKILCCIGTFTIASVCGLIVSLLFLLAFHHYIK